MRIRSQRSSTDRPGVRLSTYRRLILTALASGSLVLTLLVGGPSAQATSAGVVVNEVYGGGGNSGATLQNDFVELTNRGSSPVDVSGWTVQYISAAPGANSVWQSTALTGSVVAGSLYLVGEGAGAGGTEPLPNPAVSGSINLSGTSGTIALVRTSTLLTCKTAADCAADPSIVDLIGYGTAVVNESAAAPALTNTTSAQRIATPDTDVNSADFAAATPTPGAANQTGGSGPGGGTEPGPLRIHDLQGPAWLSPHDDEPVTGVPGVVTAVRATGSSRGYWIQDPTPDTNPATSEGIFVFTNASPIVAPGDSVLVAGTVNDFYPGGAPATNSNLSITEIQQSGVTVLGHGVALPGPEVIKANTVPALYAPYIGGNLESTTVVPSRSAVDFWESREGMRVEVDDARVVGPGNEFGELYITTKPNEKKTYRGGTEITGYDAMPAGRLEVAPVSGQVPPVNVNDVLAGATVGPVDYNQFGGYLIAATTLGARLDNNLTPDVAAPQKENQLSVATYNVENLAPSDPQSKFDRLAAGVVTNLASPDVLTVEEIQDNSGAIDDGVVAADQTLNKLTAAILVAGGPDYSWRSVDPVNDTNGGQPGGNIRVAFLFNPDRVSFVETGRADAGKATQVIKYQGQPHLSLSPGLIDPTNPAWTASRKPLVGEFLFHGQTVFVIGNHFNSKGGDQSADGRFQPPARTSEVQRQQQALLVHDFVQTILKANGSARVVVVGDLNDYQFSPALQVLKTGSAAAKGKSILTDLITTLPVNRQYTYVFNGVSQVLDHILVTSGVGKASYEVVHLNAEFADQVSDHDPQLIRIKI